MERTEFVKHLKASIDTLELCTTPDCNWCPTCQSEGKMIKTLAHLFEKDQLKKGVPIKEAYNKSISREKTE